MLSDDQFTCLLRELHAQPFGKLLQLHLGAEKNVLLLGGPQGRV